MQVRQLQLQYSIVGVADELMPNSALVDFRHIKSINKQMKVTIPHHFGDFFDNAALTEWAFSLTFSVNVF